MSKRVQIILSDEAFEKLNTKIQETKHTASRQCAVFVEDALTHICHYDFIDRGMGVLEVNPYCVTCGAKQRLTI